MEELSSVQSKNKKYGIPKTAITESKYFAEKVNGNH
jgi:hypothetical protein